MNAANFKVKPLRWVPHIEPVEMEAATDEQNAAMQVTPSAGKVSAYVRTLAHDPESYVNRTHLYNAIMYFEGGLDHADREMAALSASCVNGCVYCASVHARRYIQLTGNSDVVRTLYLDESTDGLDERSRAIIAFSRKLSRTPPEAGADEMARLREVGLSDGEIVDLIHAVAIFGWANRLMHTLGHAE